MTQESLLQILTEMIEEAQREANISVNALTRYGLIAKRDALDELKFRLRDGRVNLDWTRPPAFWS